VALAIAESALGRRTSFAERAGSADSPEVSASAAPFASHSVGLVHLVATYCREIAMATTL
jgi:hypothetical protein